MDLMIHDLDLALLARQGAGEEVSAAGFRGADRGDRHRETRASSFGDGCVASLLGEPRPPVPVKSCAYFPDRRLRLGEPAGRKAALCAPGGRAIEEIEEVHAGGDALSAQAAASLAAVARQNTGRGERRARPPRARAGAGSPAAWCASAAAGDGMKPANPDGRPGGRVLALKDRDRCAVGRGARFPGATCGGRRAKRSERELAAYTGAPHASASTRAPMRCTSRSSRPASRGRRGRRSVLYLFRNRRGPPLYTGATPVFARYRYREHSISTLRPFRTASPPGQKRSSRCICSASGAAWMNCQGFAGKDLLLVEDCAQALGADYDGRARRQLGRFRLLFVLSDQESWRRGRRRSS